MRSRIAYLVLIYLGVTGAWAGLALTVEGRTHDKNEKLQGDVAQLWGEPQEQYAPEIDLLSAEEAAGDHFLEPGRVRHAPDGSEIDVSLGLEHRRRGLLWYPTYRVGFAGIYTITNPHDEDRFVRFSFGLPSRKAIYDNIHLRVDGEDVVSFEVVDGNIRHLFPLGPGESGTIAVSYGSQGMDEWGYTFGEDVTQVKAFHLKMTTNFDKIDFPLNTVSPTRKIDLPDGQELHWEYVNLLSGAPIGLEMPRRMNPGPWVSMLISSAPVSLFLFLFLLFVITTVRGISLHPMNLVFVCGAFFSFHLLLAYLVDHVSIHVAFVLCSSVSIFLVVSYMRIIVGRRFAFLEAGLAQFVYLVLFSYAFFFEGYTGLSITVLCIITLFVVMQYTGRLDWGALFSGKGGRFEPSSPQPEAI